MKKQQITHMLGICLAMALLTCSASEATAEKQESPKETVYKVNQTRTYKVMFPKTGYIGNPASASSIKEFMQPTSEEHFKACYVRVTIVADRIRKGNKRIVLRMDEVDEKLNMLREGLYYSYVDFLPEGIKSIYRCADDDSDYTETGIRFGIPFPFSCTRPPLLVFLKGYSEGYRDKSGLGVRYLKKENKDNSSVVNIDAERFENVENLGELGSRTAKWYKSEVDDVVKSKKTTVVYREKQKWASEGDWLWDEMERFDKDGNILMKCKKIQ